MSGRATFRIWRGDASGGAFVDYTTGVSEGMVLSASGEGPGIFLLSPDSGAKPGMKVS